ncbi:MAG: alkaline phosphatase [Pseudomonadota bacterium]
MKLQSFKTNVLKATTLAVMCVLGAQTAYAEDAATWYQDGQAALAASKQIVPNAKRAKNVILFVGDGMGVSTVTAARIFEGQLRGVDGERNLLSFEKLPYVAMSKTYSTNQQTADSAPTMTAMVTGVKTNDGVLSVNQNVFNGGTDNAAIQANKLTTILELAEQNGRSTGVVSTARITHATPAATYAHTSTRDWETKTATTPAAGVNDIAAQAIDNFGLGKVGDGIEVFLGGGRTKFLPNTANDPEDAGRKGERTDGRNLITEYQTKFGADYVWNKAQFDAINPANTNRLIGLFERSHMEFEYDRPTDTAKEPSLAEMTDKAIDVLKKNPNGYFLMVEAGRIDHGHHAGNAYRALSDTVALSDAVKKALEKVDLKDTLIIVTADHSHTMTMAGYPARGNPVLGKVINPGETVFALAEDGKPYTTVSYANGKGYHVGSAGEGVYTLPTVAGRPADMTTVDTTDPDFHQEALVPVSAETHAAEDVQVFAGGPKAYLFHGVQEQSYIFHVMKDAFGFN